MTQGEHSEAGNIVLKEEFDIIEVKIKVSENIIFVNCTLSTSPLLRLRLWLARLLSTTTTLVEMLMRVAVMVMGLMVGMIMMMILKRVIIVMLARLPPWSSRPPTCP